MSTDLKPEVAVWVDLPAATEVVVTRDVDNPVVQKVGAVRAVVALAAV
jgi:hypothetical protein